MRLLFRTFKTSEYTFFLIYYNNKNYTMCTFSKKKYLWKKIYQGDHEIVVFDI